MTDMTAFILACDKAEVADGDLWINTSQIVSIKEVE